MATWAAAAVCRDQHISILRAGAGLGRGAGPRDSGHADSVTTFITRHAHCWADMNSDEKQDTSVEFMVAISLFLNPLLIATI